MKERQEAVKEKDCGGRRNGEERNLRGGRNSVFNRTHLGMD